MLVRGVERHLQRLQQGPPNLGNRGLASPFHLLDQRRLPRDPVLGLQHTSSCHFQGLVDGRQPPSVAEWRRWEPFAFVGTHFLTGSRAEHVQQFVAARCGRGVVRVMFGWSRHRFLPCGVRENAISPASGIDLDQLPLPQVPSDSMPPR